MNMKRLLLLVPFMLSFLFSVAQKDKGPEFEVVENVEVCDTIWLRPSTPSTYPGGSNEMYDFLFHNMENSDRLQSYISGKKMVVRLTVSEKGEIVGKKVLREVEPSLTADVLQAVDKFPLLKPAHEKGKDVCSYFLLLVNFK
jgi:hypothetical protein